jgi:FtsP/CotA-like multicopper oxidase with cupredoxin domain
MHATRRDVLKAGGITVLGAAGTLALPWGTHLGAREASLLDGSRLPLPFRTGFVRPPVLRPWKTERDADGRLVDHFSVTERAGRAQIVPGMTTPVWGYNGHAPGPTIPVQRGRPVVMRVRNHLPAQHPILEHEFTTSLHLHGSGSLPEYDGYADDVSPPGFYKDYHFPNRQPARTLWYHDHGVHHTAPNVYTGLYAQYQMHDEAERALLPQGEYDVPLVVGDAMFGTDGSLAYDDESETGLWGDVILVNGKAWPVMKVRRRVYRFRILNAAISRSFRFRLGNGDPVTMVCTDGGLMPRSREVAQWRHGNAERYEILIDFRTYRPGQRVVLQNLSNDNNRDYDHTDKVMAFDVTDAPVDRSDPTWNRLPNTLADSHVMSLREEQATKTRRLEFHHSNSLWMINGRTWADVIASDYRELVADPALNGIEIWELSNPHGGWFHPVHIHLIDFKILDRNGRPPFDYEQGPKDVAYLGENETVRVLIKFAPHRGRYMVHCHNLVHEDHDMMVQFAVGWKPGDPDDHHPVLADPCKIDNLPELDAALPGRPGDLRGRAGRDQATLAWDAPIVGGHGITAYRIRGHAPGRRSVDVTVSGRRRHVVRGLARGATYRFTVTGINAKGASPASAPVELFTGRRDRQGPRVVRRTPRPGAWAVRRRARLKVWFDEPVRNVSARTVRLRRVGGRRVPARVSYHPRAQRVTVVPRRPLKPGASYRVRLSRGLRDANGNRLGRAVVWRFTASRR